MSKGTLFSQDTVHKLHVAMQTIRISQTPLVFVGKFLASNFQKNQNQSVINCLYMGRKITGNCNWTLLAVLRGKIVEKRRNLSKGVLSSQNNAPAHKSHDVMHSNTPLIKKNLESS